MTPFDDLRVQITATIPIWQLQELARLANEDMVTKSVIIQQALLAYPPIAEVAERRAKGAKA